MPYIVEVSNGIIKYPTICPYCETNQADSEYKSKYTKFTGFYLIFYSYKVFRIMLPACKACVKYFRQSGWWCIFFAIFLIPCFIILLSLDFIEKPLLLSLLMGLYFGPFAYFLYGKWRSRAFRLTYIGDKLKGFSVRSQRFAEAFAQANGSTSNYRLIYFKLFNQ